MENLKVSEDLREMARKAIGAEAEANLFNKYSEEVSKIGLVPKNIEALGVDAILEMFENAAAEQTLESEFDGYGAAGYSFDVKGKTYEASLVDKSGWVMVSIVDKTRFNEKDNYPETFYGIAPRGQETKLTPFEKPIQDDYALAKSKALLLISNKTK